MKKQYKILLCISMCATQLVYAGNYLEWSHKTAYLTVKQGIGYCDTLVENGKSDWRLPKIKELFTLVNYRQSTPLKDDYWSSSPFRYGQYTGDYRKDHYWYISEDGLIQEGMDFDHKSVRCVRSKR